MADDAFKIVGEATAKGARKITGGAIYDAAEEGSDEILYQRFRENPRTGQFEVVWSGNPLAMSQEEWDALVKSWKAKDGEV
jgi:hypothetical protein